MTLNNKRILIVEDNAENRLVYQIILSRSGAMLTFERWGTSILTRLQSHPQYDLIILDLMLSGSISGFTVFEQIRAQKAYNAIPIVAISAADPCLMIPRTRALGFTGFISKPVDEDLLPSLLSRILAGESIWMYDSTKVH